MFERFKKSAPESPQPKEPYSVAEETLSLPAIEERLAQLESAFGKSAPPEDGLSNFRKMPGYFRSIQDRITSLERSVEYLKEFSHGARAVYMGNNRVLVRIVVRGCNIVYFVPADDLLISPWFIATGGYETMLTDFFVDNLKPDSHCLDIGANFGYFTCLMARFCPAGKVVGVEADKTIAELVRDNLAINGFEQFGKVVHAAACDAHQDITLYRRVTRAANTSIIAYDSAYTESMGEPPAERFTVQGIRIDELADDLGGRVDFIKIDVEGAEPLALRGAANIIRNNPQLTIIMEWSPGQITAAGFELKPFLDELDGFGLEPFDIAAGKLSRLSQEELLNIPYAAGIALKPR